MFFYDIIVSSGYRGVKIKNIFKGWEVYMEFLFKNKTARSATLIFTGIVILINVLGISYITQLIKEESKNFVMIFVDAGIMMLCTVTTFFTIKWINNKIHWYESILDSIPFPISVTDSNMNWTFINRPVEDMLKVKRSEMIGKHCSNWNANICKTNNCGIACLRNNKKSTFFNQADIDFKVDINYLHGRNGKNVVGHIEVVQDISDERKIQHSQLELIQQIKEFSETFSSISGQVTNSSEENALLAIQAAKHADDIMKNAIKGKEKMENMTRAVGEINDANHSISKVVNIINDITSRTNILSINATIEASRAGEQGRGFAVVAEEVRMLASKSSNSSDTITNLIQDSIVKAELGFNIASETSQSLNEIVEGIKASDTLINEIAKSSEEQLEAITQMKRGIEHMSRVLNTQR